MDKHVLWFILLRLLMNIYVGSDQWIFRIDIYANDSCDRNHIWTTRGFRVLYSTNSVIMTIHKDKKRFQNFIQASRNFLDLPKWNNGSFIKVWVIICIVNNFNLKLELLWLKDIHLSVYHMYPKDYDKKFFFYQIHLWMREVIVRMNENYNK